MDFKEKYDKFRQQTESALRKAVPEGVCKALHESMNYSLLGGGKRLRPILYLSVLDAYGITATDSDMKVACAIECVHTYSLIHDDLPAMDNDDYRRGEPTNHKKFGEAVAILAGDGLLNLAYELLADAVVCDPKYAPVMQVIAENAGMLGMVGGQAQELTADPSTLRDGVSEQIAYLKTGKLIEAAVVAACRAAGKTEDEKNWRSFAVDFGTAFQLRDDLLDMAENENSIVKFISEAKASSRLEYFYINVITLLKNLDCDTAFLRALSDKMLLRTTDGI